MRLRHGFATRAALLACGVTLGLGVAAQPAAADHRRGGGGWRGGGSHGGFHGGFHHHHFHSFVFFGAGLGLGYPYYPYYPSYPAYYPPPAYAPTYVSPTECYQPPVPRGPGVADLYTCSGQYVGPIAVP